MCLIIFDWQEHSKQLTLLANRDEFFSRPASPIDYWPSHPEIFGGRDLSAGGTWLAVSKNGRLAAVTNYRELPAHAGESSRGEIPVNFLESDASAEQHAHGLAQENAYSGFNALFFDGNTLAYTSNKAKQAPTVLGSGVYGLSNHLLDTPWPKLLKAKQAYVAVREQVGLSNDARHQAWLDLMCDSEQALDQYLPNTGIGPEGEKFLSSVFIRSPAYGTRATSLVSINPSTITFVERSFDAPKAGESPLEQEAETITRNETILRKF